MVESVPRANQDLINTAMRQYEKYSGDLEDMNAYDKKPPAPPATPPAGDAKE